jgi:hypothetical protein
MEAIITKAPRTQLDNVAGEWLRASGKLVRAVLRATGHFLVYYSRAAILLRTGGRASRRII